MSAVAVNVTVVTTDTPPATLAGVRWTVSDDMDTVIYGSGKTDQQGEFNLSLEEGTTYHLYLTEAYTTFTPNPCDLVVSSFGLVPDPSVLPSQEFTFNGVYEAPYASGLDLCIVYGTLSDLCGVDFPDAKITAENVYGTVDIADLDVIGRISEAVTDANGRFSLELLRGATVRIYAHNTKTVFRVVVPDQDKIRITDLMDLAEDEIQDIVRG